MQPYLCCLGGALLGLLGSCMPNGAWVGYSLSGFLGLYGVLGCVSSTLIFSSWRECRNPAGGNDPSLICLNGYEVPADPIKYALYKLLLVGLGLLFGWFLVSVQLDRVAPVLSWGLLVYLIYRSVPVGQRGMGFLVLGAIGVVTLAVASWGFSLAVIAVSSAVSFGYSEQPTPAPATHRTFAYEGFVIGLGGLLGGVLPGINASGVAQVFAKSERLYIVSLLSSAVAEGVGLGIFFWGRNTTKTTSTTWLSGYAGGDTLINPWLLCFLLLGVMVICLYLQFGWRLVAAMPGESTYCQFASLWFFCCSNSFDNNIAVGFVAAAILWFVGRYLPEIQVEGLGVFSTSTPILVSGWGG